MFIPTTFFGQTTPPKLGDYFGGGVVAFITGSYPNLSGLVVATNDYGAYGSDSASFGCSGTFTGATGSAYGTGAWNTNTITGSCNDVNGAAYLCSVYSGSGYTDWFLPSSDEWSKICVNKSYIPNLNKQEYWTSTDVDTTHAYSIALSTCGLTYLTWNKGVAWGVRPTRYFNWTPNS